MKAPEAFSKGFDRGNYAQAYESECFDTYLSGHEEPSFSGNVGKHRERLRDAYALGLLFGFYSSHELHEVPAEDRSTMVNQMEDARHLALCCGIALD